MKCLSLTNVLFKYSDNTNLVVPENTDMDLANLTYRTGAVRNAFIINRPIKNTIQRMLVF